MTATARFWILCCLYVLTCSSGCSIAMALNGVKEPNFERIATGSRKEEIDFEFNQPGTFINRGDGVTEVTYTYKIGNSPNPARASIYGYYDLIFIGIPEPIFTLIELFQGHKEVTTVTYGPDNRATAIVGYSPPPISDELKAAQQEQEQYVRKAPSPHPNDRMATPTKTEQIPIAPSHPAGP